MCREMRSIRIAQLFLFAACIFAQEYHWTYASSDKNDFKNHFRPLRSVEYETVHPVRLDLNGNFMSHNLHFMNLDSNEKVSRRKRDVDDEQIQFLKVTPRLLYSLSHGDQLMTLNLTENEVLIPEDFLVERIGKSSAHSIDSMTTIFSRGTAFPCHFRGHVEGQPDSRVALSTCHGLSGLISTKDGDYFLEPLEPQKSDDNEGIPQPHKIYKRDVSALLEKAEPMHNDKPITSRRTHEASRRTRHEFADDLDSNENFELKSLLYDDSKEYCGVMDTRRRYRHTIRKRVQWERKQQSKTKGSFHESSKRRSKRSVSAERIIEMLVVADKTMVDFYESNGYGGIEKYVLTIINMVSEIFKDASIGNSLQISLVRLILVEDEEKGPKITSHAENTLDSFCQWAKKMNPRGDDHPNHHDVAVLLTRREICSKINKSCETLGLAHVAGMCQSHRSCSLNQDIGLSVAYTVAHELGHNFAMHHDGQMNDCKLSTKYNYVMAPHLTSSKLTMKWSSCSRKYITRFLDRNWGFCLNDKPAEHPEFSPPSALPGVLYDADHQCRLMFGQKSRYCHGIDDMCDRLWCHVDGTCRTRLHAAVQGTKCGRNRWCLGGRCVSMRRRPKTVNGEWGKWSKWTSCSRTCGIGVTSSFRHCDNPAPQNGGNYCIGERKRYKTCSKWRCSDEDDASTFRAQQCSSFNNVHYKNKTFTWLPVESTLYPCELHCFTRSGTAYFADRLRDKVIDGTKCFPGSDDICVDGICRRVGCDRNIGSRALEDRCGVCHGNGSCCYEVKKIFSRRKGEEYTPAGLIPLGARNIEILEIESAANFLALRHATNATHYYLNGNYMIQWDTMFQLAGTQFTYKRENETRDIIIAPGPLTKDIMLMVLFVEENPGVSIEYTMPYDINFDPSPKAELPEFSWKVHGWSKCSTGCGGGRQILVIVCEEKIAGVVEDFFCNATERPAGKQRSCNESPCPAKWLTTPWSQCSVTCGKRKGSQIRSVACVRFVGEDGKDVLNETECAHMERPPHLKKCHAVSRLPCPVWRTGDWQNCSHTCGGGVMNRTVECVTYIEDDIIDPSDVGTIPGAEDVDISVIDSDLMPSRRKTQKRSRSDHLNAKKENLLPARGLMMSIEMESIDFDPDLDGYEVQDDELCDAANRPKSQKSCNLEECPSTTSPAVETTSVTENSTTGGFVNSTTEQPQTESDTKTEDKADFNVPINDQIHHNSNFSLSRNISGTAPNRQNATFQKIPAGMMNHPPILTQPNDATRPYMNVNLTSSSINIATRLSPTSFVNKTDNHFTMSPPLPTDASHGDNDIPASLKDHNASHTYTNVEADSAKNGTTSLMSLNADDPNSEDAIRKLGITYPDIKSPVARTIPDETDDVPLPTASLHEAAKTDFKSPGNLAAGDKMENRTVVSRKTNDAPQDESDSPVPEKPDLFLLDTEAKDPINEDTEIGTPSGRSIRLKTYTKSPNEDDKNEFDNWNETDQTRQGDSKAKIDPEDILVPELRNVDLDFDVTIVQNEPESDKKTEILDSSETSSSTKTSEQPSEADSTEATLPATTLPVKGEWILGEWSKCSVTCGVGAKIRHVGCSLDNDKLCDQTDRPVPAMLCNLRPCAKWAYGEWTKCTTLCGTGTQVKTTECVEERTGKPLRPHHCRNLPTLPIVKISCHQNKCLKWKTSRWTSCSEPCGHGTQRRRVACSFPNQCDMSVKPHETKSCYNKPCVEWKALDWNKCSVHCGGGIRRREIVCVEKGTEIRTNTSYCDPVSHPTRVERCNQGQCPVTDYDFSNCHADRLSRSFCVLLQKLGRCVQPSLAIQCCVTCKTYLSIRHKDKMS